MATPTMNSPEDLIIKSLRADSANRAEVFFRCAKSLGDPLSGFEDADFWSVQALSLMSVYMLAVSKRNAAYAYYGMAVRTAFALGLHRIGDVHLIFDRDQVIVRRNLWRSLFVLDRFLASSLGRPTAISEEDCSEDSLVAPQLTLPHGHQAVHEGISSNSLSASVKACHSIGQILKKVYSKRKISTRLAQDIASGCDMWASIPCSDLDAKRLFTGDVSAGHAIAILHVQLLHCHSIILLTRPFFLYLVIRVQKDKNSMSQTSRRTNSRLQRFSEACVAASIRTIDLVLAAYDHNYMSRRNPFVLYFLFAASLIILSNEFACLYKNSRYSKLVSDAITMMEYCAVTDVQAHRLLFILTSFRSVVGSQAYTVEMVERSRSMQMDMSDGGFTDPLAGLSFRHHGSRDHHLSNGNLPGFSRTTSTSMLQKDLRFAAPVTSKPQQPMTAGAAAQPEGSQGIAAPSPGSTQTASSQSRTDNSGRHGTDGEGGESLGGEQEFDFDSLWDFQPALGSTSLTPVTSQAVDPRSAFEMQQPAANDGPPRYGRYSAYGAPGGGSGQPNRVVLSSTVPLFHAVDFSGG